MSLGECCHSGVRLEGSPEGREEVIGGVNTYVALPKGPFDDSKALLFLTDIFGLGLTNSKLLVDDFAANGWAVYMPDYLNGDPAPVDALAPGSPFKVWDWFQHHGTPQTRPPLDAVIAALKRRGVTSFAATGHCLGGRYAADLTCDGAIQVALYHHPSLLELDDLPRLAASGVPSLWNCCAEDQMFGREKQAALVAAFGGKEGFDYRAFEVSHGFTNRGDVSVPAVRAAKEEAFARAVAFLKKHF